MSLPRDVVHQRLQQIFRNVFDNDDIVLADATTAKDIPEWDSLMHISLIVAVEKEFKVRLNAAEIGKLSDVGAMISLLCDRAG